jgi:hypothetical protein
LVDIPDGHPAPFSQCEQTELEWFKEGKSEGKGMIIKGDAIE